MSARDSESGSSTYKGGSGSAGGLGNGGLGGGMGGGFGGGGAARMGGAGNQTGLGTGTTTFGNSAFGRAGGNAVAYGMRDAASLNRAGMGPTAGSFGNFRTPSGAAMFGGSPVQGQSFRGMNMGQALSQAARAQAAWQAANQPRPQVGGLLGGTSVSASSPPMPQSGYAPWTGNVDYNWGGDFTPYNPYSPGANSGVGPDPYAAPGLSYNYNIQMAPGQRPGNAWAGGGLAGLNRPANRGPSTGTSSYPSTNGGYPSLGARDTRPAGVY